MFAEEETQIVSYKGAFIAINYHGKQFVFFYNPANEQYDMHATNDDGVIRNAIVGSMPNIEDDDALYDAAEQLIKTYLEQNGIIEDSGCIDLDPNELIALLE